MMAARNWEWASIQTGRTARYAVHVEGYPVFESSDPDRIVERIRSNPRWVLSADQAADWNCDDLAEVRA